MELKFALSQIGEVARIKATLSARDLPQRVIQGVALPLVFAGIVGAGKNAEDVRVAFGVAFLSACFLVMRVPALGLANARVTGVNRLLSVVGRVSGKKLMAVQVIGAAALSLPPFALFLFFAGMPHAGWAWLLPFCLTLLILHGFGVALALSRLEVDAVLLVIDLAIAASITLCPIFYALADVPAPLRTIVSILPPSLAAETTLELWRQGEANSGDLLLLAGWTAAVLAFAHGLPGSIRLRLPWHGRGR